MQRDLSCSVSARGGWKGLHHAVHQHPSGDGALLLVTAAASAAAAVAASAAVVVLPLLGRHLQRYTVGMHMRCLRCCELEGRAASRLKALSHLLPSKRDPIKAGGMQVAWHCAASAALNSKTAPVAVSERFRTCLQKLDAATTDGALH